MAMAKARAFTVLLILFYATLQKRTIVDGANDLFNTSTIAFTYDHSKQKTLDNFKRTSDVTTKNGIVWLTPDPRTQQQTQMGDKTGWLLYNTPFTSLPNITSFHTSFQFQFITPSGASDGGDGMTFFISPYHTIPEKSGGGFFGIANGTYMDAHLFAVEFDTSLTPQFDDPSQSHVGIDINTVVSNSCR